MRNKVESTIILLSVTTVAAVYPSAVSGGVVWSVTMNNDYALIAMLASYPIFFLITTIGFVKIAAWASDRLREDEGWITTRESPESPARRVKVFSMGKRDHETERVINR